MYKKYIIVATIMLLVSIYLITKKPKDNLYLNGDYSYKLETQDGSISSENFKGKVVILYFGYMFCPDICPTTLNDIKNSLSNLNEKQLKNIQVLFVSVDPSRDSLSGLQTYAQYFDENFIGATSNEKIIKDLTNRFHAYYSYEKQENSALDYTVAHTTRIYILNKNGMLVNTLSTHNIDTKQISDAIKDAL